MTATHLPPNPYLERRHFRSSAEIDHDRNARTVVTVLLTLLGLLAVAALGGAIWLLPDYLQHRRVVARMGPMNVYTLPEIRVDLGGVGGPGTTVDMTLKIELDTKYKGKKIEPYVDRITDRLGDRVREVGIRRLQSQEGAELVKSMTKSILRQEVPGIKFKDVLIDNLIVRTPYSLGLPPVHAPLPAPSPTSVPARLREFAVWSPWPGTRHTAG